MVIIYMDTGVCAVYYGSPSPRWAGRYPAGDQASAFRVTPAQSATVRASKLTPFPQPIPTRGSMTTKKWFQIACVFAAGAGLTIATSLFTSHQAKAEDHHERDEGDSRVRIGFAVAP